MSHPDISPDVSSGCPKVACLHQRDSESKTTLCFILLKLNFCFVDKVRKKFLFYVLMLFNMITVVVLQL